MPKWEWSVHGLLSRVLAGGTMGCVVLLVTNIAFITPIWRPLWKGDERWETVFGIAAFGLPAALPESAYTCCWHRQSIAS